MGTDYYVVCEERRDLFALYRGDWESVIGLGGGEPLSKEAFALEALRVWLERYDDEVASEYALAVGRTLWDWCNDRGWKVKVINDAFGDWNVWCDWPITGSIDQIEPEVRAKQSTSERQEIEALLGDRRAVLSVVSDLRRYRVATKKFLDVWTRWSGTGCWLAPDTTASFVREVNAIEAGKESEERGG